MDRDDEIRWLLPDAGLPDRLAECAPRVLGRRPWVRAAWLYGSAASCTRPARDVDIGLLAQPVPPWGEPLRIADELAEATGVRAVPFDVRLLGGADPVFLNDVLRTGRLLYEADRAARLRFERRAIVRWLDFRPVRERLLAAERARRHP